MSPCLTLRISHPSTHSSCFHWCPAALHFMQLQNFITLKSALFDLLPYSSCLWQPLQFLVPMTYQGSFTINSCCTHPLCSKQPPCSVGCALMMLLVPSPASPFPASVTSLSCSASSTWTLAQPHTQIYSFTVPPVWVGWIISVFLNCNSSPSCWKLSLDALFQQREYHRSLPFSRPVQYCQTCLSRSIS